MTLIILLSVGFLATVIGAVSGLGGGVIIKPLLDALTSLDAAVISFLSTCAVLTMSLASVLKYRKDKVPFEKRTLLLGAGAVVGGFAGTQIFEAINSFVQNDILIKAIQNSVLLLLLAAILYYINSESKVRLNIQNSVAIVFIGCVPGMFSAFLGIGGGPVNIAVLSFFFSMSLKHAVKNSIVLILFSQTSKIVTLLATQAIPPNLPPSMLICIIPAAIAGGLVGSAINKKISHEKLKYVCNAVIAFVIFTCLWNVIKVL